MNRRTQIEKLAAKKLSLQREKYGLTQKMLGKELNISEKQIRNFEESARPIPGSLLYVMAKILNTPLSSFIEEDKGKEKENTSVEYLFNALEMNSLKMSDNEEFYIAENNIQTHQQLLTIIKAFLKIENPQIKETLVNIIQTAASFSRG